MKILLFVLLVLFLNKLTAQQNSPLKIIAAPISNEIIVSGLGGGNLNDFKFSSISSSAQIAIDANLHSFDGKKNKKGNDRLNTISLLGKYNPLSTRILDKDSIPAKKLPFADNEYLIQFGVRYRSITELSASAASKRFSGNSYTDFLQSFYFDFMYTPYKIKVDSNQCNFNTVNLNTGYQIALIKNKTKLGNIAAFLSSQINYLIIHEESSNVGDFDKVYQSTLKLPRHYFGLGGKIILQLNDFAAHFEVRRYFNMSGVVKGLNDNVIFSFGLTATGTAFDFGQKIPENRW
jgi:hypothetical protein